MIRSDNLLSRMQHIWQCMNINNIEWEENSTEHDVEEEEAYENKGKVYTWASSQLTAKYALATDQKKKNDTRFSARKLLLLKH